MDEYLGGEGWVELLSWRSGRVARLVVERCASEAGEKQ